MNNGNGGPGNVNAGNFERSMAEAPKFTPEVLPIPDQKEADSGLGAENESNPNANAGLYLDPSMLGNTALNASMYGDATAPALGEVVDEGTVGMKALTEDQIIGTDVNISKLEKNGVTKELETKLDAIKKIPNLYMQQIRELEESKKALASSFENRKGLMSNLGKGTR